MRIGRLKYSVVLLVFMSSCGMEEPYDLDIPKIQDPDISNQEYLFDLGPENYEGVPVSDMYEVSIIQDDKRKKVVVFQNACPTYSPGYMDMTENDQFPLDIFKGRTINWVNFSFDGVIRVEVKVISHAVKLSSSVMVWPSRHQVVPAITDNIISFTLDKPGQYSVEIGTEGYKNGLVIFANPRETDIPDPHASQTIVLKEATQQEVNNVPSSVNSIYFDKGVHHIGIYELTSNIKSIYLKEGAWVYGSFIMDGKSDVKIYGRGVLSSGEFKYRESHCIEARNGSNNIILDGITVADSKYFAVRLIGKNNKVSWVKIIGGWTYNCDGIAAYEGSTVKNCFIWANDDAIKIYRNNINWSDIVVWQLNNGGIIQMGWGGSNATNVNVSNVDVLRAEWNKPGFNRGLLNCVGNRYQNPGQSGSQKNWIIENVYTETAVPVVFNITPDPFSYNEIKNITLKNWNVKMPMNTSFVNEIKGNSNIQANYISGLVFDNVVFNNTRLTNADWLAETKAEISNLVEPTFK